MEVSEESRDIVSPRSRRNSRPRLLHNCGASLLTMAHKTYRKAEALESPIGSLARTLASIARPITQPLEHQWLWILAFIDNQILAIEDIAMTVFPPFTPIFNKIDELALLAESLPKMLDDKIDGLGMLIHQLFTSEGWNSSNGKDIVVDIKCDEQPKRLVSSEEAEDKIDEETEKSDNILLLDNEWMSQSAVDDIREVVETCNGIMEALEKTRMVVEEEEEEEEEQKKKGGGEDGVKQPAAEAAATTNDSILELFDEGWQLKTLRGKKVQ